MKTLILLASILFYSHAFAGFAAGTAVSTPDGLIAIENIAIESNVLAGAITQDGISFSPATIHFSSGALTDSFSKVVFLSTSKSSLISTMDALLMRVDGTLARVDKLMPGDQLISADGTPDTVTSVSVGSYAKSIHHISTSSGPATGVDGHLIIVNGIVAADFALQVSQN